MACTVALVVEHRVGRVSGVFCNPNHIRAGHELRRCSEFGAIAGRNGCPCGALLFVLMLVGIVESGKGGGEVWPPYLLT